MSQINIAPTIGVDVDTITPMGFMTLTIHYLVSPMQRPETANRSPTFGMTAAQARELAARILEAAQHLETAPVQPGGFPKH